MPSSTTFFAAESGRISGQAAPSINAHHFSFRYSGLRPNVRAEWTGIPGAGGAYAAAVPRVTVTLEPFVRALLQF
jgi:hypothetical protein